MTTLTDIDTIIEQIRTCNIQVVFRDGNLDVHTISFDRQAEMLADEFERMRNDLRLIASRELINGVYSSEVTAKIAKDSLRTLSKSEIISSSFGVVSVVSVVCSGCFKITLVPALSVESTLLEKRDFMSFYGWSVDGDQSSISSKDYCDECTEKRRKENR